MKKIHISLLLMLSLQVMSIDAAQASSQNVELARQVMINNTVKNLTYLTDGFNFLQTQNLVGISFHDFLEQHVSHDEHEDEEMNLDQVIIDAENILTDTMKDRFLQTLDTSLQERKNINQFDDPVFLYVMQYKDDDIRDMVHLWLYEWNNTKDKLGTTQLHYAIYLPDIARMLIDAGADVNTQDENGIAPLHKAVKWNLPETTGMLIDACADVNIQNRDGETPLHIAASLNRINVAKMLILAGADIHTQNKDGRTAFTIVLINNDIVLYVIAMMNIAYMVMQFDWTFEE
ncbi:ankyrin repeat domain-containing protein [Candidatus Chromulinivorax destructor]|nr:ankyrin repeat domain-containing protein [Candidatus Chromulinivorax destructor]